MVMSRTHLQPDATLIRSVGLPLVCIGRLKATTMAAQAQPQDRANWMSRKKGLPRNVMVGNCRQTLWDGSNSKWITLLLKNIQQPSGGI